jgi:hypothetical protein
MALLLGNIGGVDAEGEQQISRESAAELVTMIEARRLATVNLIYQSPALSLAAQAFLFVIALDPATSGLGRLIASVVGALAAAATALSILKHNYTEEKYGSAVDHLQEILGRPRLHRSEIAVLADEYGKNEWYLRWDNKRWRRWVRSLSATDFWITVLTIYLVIDLGLLVLSVLQMAGVGNPLAGT